MTIDLLHLFKLRAAVGRFGEMDGAGWWNTQGVLGARGASVYKRGLPRTHFLARVRVVTSVAADRSRTVYPSSGVATLWELPLTVERSLAFQERSWATNGVPEGWGDFEAMLGPTPTDDLTDWLVALGLTAPSVAESAKALKLEPGGKGLSVPGPVTDHAIQLLAVGHKHGGPKNLVVPFVRDGLDDAIG